MNVPHHFANNLLGYSDEELAMALESQLAAVRVAVSKPAPFTVAKPAPSSVFVSAPSRVSVPASVTESTDPCPEVSFSTMSDAVIVLSLLAQLEMGQAVVPPVAQRDFPRLVLAHHEENETSDTAGEPALSVESFLTSEALAAEGPFLVHAEVTPEVPPRVPEPSFDDLIFGNPTEG